PRSVGTRVKAPFEKSLVGSSGRFRPSTTVPQVTLPGVKTSSALAGMASSTLSTATARRHDRVSAAPFPSQPSALVSALLCVYAEASVAVAPKAHAPLSRMARSKRPLLGGETRCVHTLMPPADSPKRVTSWGSPPKAEMLARVQATAARWSSMPYMPEDGC